jgi:DNA-binding PadR family transcriptional regulator
MFEQGDLKYVILQLLSEKPRHGYEIIKALEEKFAGAYAPSAGAVYPTLSLLEDLGYATVTVEEGGKKVYTITEAGTAYLAENKSAVDDVFDRISDFGSSFLSDSTKEIGVALGRLAKATFANSGSYLKDTEKARAVREIIDRAAREIDSLVR